MFELNLPRACGNDIPPIKKQKRLFPCYFKRIIDTRVLDMIGIIMLNTVDS